MPADFLYLASRSIEGVVAGVAGFVAGAILIGSGVIALAVLSARDGEETAAGATAGPGHLQRPGQGQRMTKPGAGKETAQHCCRAVSCAEGPLRHDLGAGRLSGPPG